MAERVYNPDFGGSTKYYYMEGTRKIYVGSQSDWNQSGQGGGNAPLYGEAPKEEAAPAPAPAPAREPSRPRSAITPKAPEEKKPTPVEAEVTQGERDYVTPPAEGLESTIKTPAPLAPRESGVKPSVVIPGIGTGDERLVGSFLTRKKREDRRMSFLTKRV